MRIGRLRIRADGVNQPNKTINLSNQTIFKIMKFLTKFSALALLATAVLLFCLEIYQTACVFPVFKDMHNGIGRPLALIAGVVAAGAARCFHSDLHTAYDKISPYHTS